MSNQQLILFTPASQGSSNPADDFLRKHDPQGFKKLEGERAYVERIKRNGRLKQVYVDGLREMYRELMATAKPVMQAEYELLGLERGAKKRDIKNAYRRKARKLHPDVGGNGESFKQLHDAYRRLLSATKE